MLNSSWSDMTGTRFYARAGMRFPLSPVADGKRRQRPMRF
jgi:hypothetical protein